MLRLTDERPGEKISEQRKFRRLKYLIASVAATVLASSAHAALNTQNYVGSSFQGLDEDSSVMTSSTTPTDTDVKYGSKGVFLYVSSTTPSAIVNIQRRNSKGVVLVSETLAVGSGVSRTYLPPIPFYDIKVSPTGGLTGSNTLHINVQQPR